MKALVEKNAIVVLVDIDAILDKHHKLPADMTALLFGHRRKVDGPVLVLGSTVPFEILQQENEVVGNFETEISSNRMGTSLSR